MEQNVRVGTPPMVPRETCSSGGGRAQDIFAPPDFLP